MLAFAFFGPAIPFDVIETRTYNSTLKIKNMFKNNLLGAKILCQALHAKAKPLTGNRVAAETPA